MKITVGTAAQYQDIDAGVTLLEVPYQIFDDSDAVVQDRVQSFPLDATQDDITAFLTQALQTYKDNAARYAETSVAQEQLDNASVVAAQISGITITE